MLLEGFIEEFVCKNTLIRLWYKCEKGKNCSYVPVIESEEDVVSMEWSTLKGEGPFKNLLSNKVIGVVDILVRDSNYSEAVNIVIERCI